MILALKMSPSFLTRIQQELLEMLCMEAEYQDASV